MTNSYYIIRVKDQCGDTIKYVSDYPPEIDEETGDLQIEAGSEGIITYNMAHVVFFSVQERTDSLKKETASVIKSRMPSEG